MKRSVLILEGGGMRGFYTAGILDTLIEHQCRFGAIYAVSAGACHAVSYMSGQLGRAKRVNFDYLDRDDYMGFKCFIKERSWFGFRLMFDIIPALYDPIDWDTFFANARTTQFNITATNAQTGKAQYFTPRDAQQTLGCVRASSSLPFISPPVVIDGVPFFDGGVADPIPIAKAQADGATDYIIVLTKSGGYRKKAMKNGWFSSLYFRSYPHMVQAMKNRHLIYNESLSLAEKLEQEGKAVILRPSPQVNTGRMERNREKLERLYLSGREDAQASIARIRMHLQK